MQPRIVEPLIALSIAYVAIENIFLSELKAWRIGLVFCFGLLHGMGFAGALKELGLPRSEFLTALLTFLTISWAALLQPNQKQETTRRNWSMSARRPCSNRTSE